MNRISYVLFACIAVILMGCANTPPKPTFAEMTFQHLPTINLNVGEIKIRNEYRSPLKAPNVEHEMPVNIERVLKRWASERLRAVGDSSAYAEFTIKDASVIETKLKKKTGLAGFFTNDQAEKYDFRVEAELKVVSINGYKGFATADSKQSRTIPEDSTLNERDSMYFERTELLIGEFNKQMEKNIFAFLGKFIKN